MAGGIIAQQALKKEAMARMKSAMTGLRGNTRTTERPIPVIYGRHRVGGNVLWMSTEGKGPNDANPPRNKLFAVYGISEGPIDGYEEMYFNDVKVWDARSGQLKTQFYNAFYPEFRTGTNSQAPFSHVATYHNLYDIASETFPLTAVAMVEFFYNPDIYQSIPNVTWTIRGKQVPDWTNVSSPGIMKWTQSGPLQVADLLTNKQYGMGISSANLNVSDLASAHTYATAAISPGSRETIEIVDMSAQRPKYYETAIQVPGQLYYTPGWDYFDPDPTGAIWSYRLTDKIPIKPGSLSFTGAYSSYVDVPRSGMISQFGQLFTTPGSVAVGSVSYLSGDISVQKPPGLYADGGLTYVQVFDYVAKWYADWEFSFRTKYQNIARSMYVVSTPETLVETGTVTGDVINLYSTQGGAGTFNYGTGELNAYFGAHEWYENQPVEIHYRVSTRARFSTNYPLFEPEKVMDAIKNIERHYRGFLVYADGKYSIKVDKPEGSVYSFDDDNIIAGTFRMHQPSVKEIPTKITLKYLDALNNFTPAEASFDVRSVDPGMEIEHVLDMPGTTARDEAMASAYSYANLANLVNFTEFETNYNALGVEAGDVVDVTHPSAAWSQKLFRVLGISFAKEDKLAISAMEHDPTAYVDDWIQGPMVSRNPSFFPRRSYWPPNVSSATLSEYSRTLSDGTVVPTLKYQIMAVDSANLSVDHWNVYYANATRGQQTRVGFSGVNTVGYLSPVEPGWNIVNIHAVSQFGNESAKVWTGSVNVQGVPEHEWQNWRVRLISANNTIIDSGGRIPQATYMEGIDRGRAKYISWNDNYYLVGSSHRLVEVVENQITQTFVASLGLSSATFHYLTPASGGNLFAFFSDEGNYYRWAGIMTQSMTQVRSFINVASSNILRASPWCGEGGKMALFGLDSTNSYFVWAALSSNLVLGPVNSFCAVSSIRPSGLHADWLMTAFNSGSKGVLVIGAVIENVNSGSRLNLHYWTFSGDGPSGNWYDAGSLFFQSGYATGVNSYCFYYTSVRGSGDFSGRVVLSFGTDPSTGANWKQPTYMLRDINSMSGVIRNFSDSTDTANQSFTDLYDSGRPSIFGNTMNRIYIKNKSIDSTSLSVEYDVYRWYRVASGADPNIFMDWI